MSGVEGAAVLGVISSIITLIDGTKKVYDAATDAKGLPDAFRQVALRLPVVQDILESAKGHIPDLNEESQKAVKGVVDACEEKAKKLELLFQKTIPGEGTSSLTRYYKAAKTLGKGNAVELLMKGILEDVQILASQHGMQITTKKQEDEVAQAIAVVSEVAASGNASFNHITTSAGTTDNEATRRYQAAFHLMDPDTIRENIRTTKGRRVDGTCEWIRSNEQYQSWLNGDIHLLWISGGPGKGKTMLSLFLIEELEKNAECTTLFFFCSSQDDKRNNAVAVLKALIDQIITKHHGLFSKHVLSYFESQEKAQNTASSVETLWIIFKKLIRDPEIGTIFCVLDGLDECDEESSRFLIGRIVEFFRPHAMESMTKSRKLVLVSRRLHGLEGTTQVNLDPDNDEKVASDIERFIAARVNELSRIEGFTDEFRTFFESTIRERAEGTFLWVGFVMNELSKKKTCTDALDALKQIPNGLPAIYDRMLLQIDSEQRLTSIKILHWVAMAARPLDLGELAVAVDMQVNTSISEDQARRDHITRCGSFLQIQGEVVGFVHQSAKDYLLRKTVHQNSILEEFRIKEEKVQFELARKCLQHISNENSNLFTYSVHYWPEHARNSGTQSRELIGLFPVFFGKKSSLRSRWTELFERKKMTVLPNDLLHMASFLGIAPWVEVFMTRGLLHIRAAANRKDKVYDRTPLSYAAENGHEVVVKLLLATGKVDADAKDTMRRTPLSFAAENGHEAVVKLLLATGKVDADAKQSPGSTPLSFAAGNGHEAVVKLLLATGKVDADAKNTYGWTPLSYAAENGHEAVVKLLLATGKVDADAKSTYGHTPLFYAAENGHEAVVKLLLATGKVDADAKSTYGHTPLFYAAENGHEVVVKLLLATGKVDADAKDTYGRTPLWLAARYGHEVVVKLLLATGKVDADTEDMYGRTPLSYAARYGHEVVVKLLLATGKVDADAKYTYGWTPLLLAASYGHEGVVRLLLATGKVDVEAKDRDGKTALLAAVEEGHETIVKMLQEAQASSSHSAGPSGAP